MGPRSFKRGNVSTAIQGNIQLYKLQWGHTPSNAETRSWASQVFCIAGYFNGATLLQAWKLTTTLTAPAWARSLQWGRALSSAETSPVFASGSAVKE